jgi:hypothetical protein
MRGRLEQRLQQLETEFDAGQQMLADLQQKRASLEQTLLRISGAIQVLEELLAVEQAPDNSVAPIASMPEDHGAVAGKGRCTG